MQNRMKLKGFLRKIVIAACEEAAKKALDGTLGLVIPD
jgi:hypothetical protein